MSMSFLITVIHIFLKKFWYQNRHDLHPKFWTHHPHHPYHTHQDEDQRGVYYCVTSHSISSVRSVQRQHVCGVGWLRAPHVPLRRRGVQRDVHLGWEQQWTTRMIIFKRKVSEIFTKSWETNASLSRKSGVQPSIISPFFPVFFGCCFLFPLPFYRGSVFDTWKRGVVPSQ